MGIMDILQRPMKLGKKNVDYEFSICTEDTYKLTLVYLMPKTWYLQLLNVMKLKTKKEIRLLDKFKIDPQFYKKLGVNITPTMSKIEKEIREDKPLFQFMTKKVIDMEIEKQNNKVKTSIFVKGVYHE